MPAWVEALRLAEKQGKDYRTDLIGYAREVCGMEPTREQLSAFETITPKDPDNFQIKEAFCTGHNIGKTAISGVVIPWFFESYRPSKLITTAPTFKQVEKQTWAEVHKWGRHLSRSNILLKTEIRNPQADYHYAVGISTDDPESFRGFHEDYILFLYEEGSGVEDIIYEAAEGSYQKNYIALILSNPGAPRGYFYDVCMGRKQGWGVTVINSEDAELPDPRWVDQMREDYGKDSPMYAMKVLGRFPDVGEDSVYSLSGIERAFDTVELSDYLSPDLRLLCCDVAEWGSDRTVLTDIWIKFGPGKDPDWVLIPHCVWYTKQDPAFTAGEIVRYAAEWESELISIDRLGVGSGAFANVMRYKGEHNPDWSALDFTGSRGAMDPSMYSNAKAEGHFTAARWFKEGLVHFGPEIDPRTRDFFKGDLLVFKYDYNDKGQYKVVDPRTAKKVAKYDKGEKLKIKSPDFGDTIGQAGWLVKSRLLYVVGGMPTVGDLRDPRPDPPADPGDSVMTVGDLFG